MNKTIWVLGAGQLGFMLKHAAQPLGITLNPVDIEEKQIIQLAPTDLVTAEREQWPITAATQQLSSHPNFINHQVFGRIADRVTQKQLLDDLNLSTAPWQTVPKGVTTKQLCQQYGERVLLKQRIGGFDGRGQLWLHQAENTPIPEGWHGQAIAEQAISFDEEMSLVGVRGRDGQCCFYPLTLNLHKEGILAVSISPRQRLYYLQTQAEKMLTSIMNQLDYVGVMAMECFRVGDELMINELAPRVHNSGHWTQAGANISQFELHLRAIANLPLDTPTIKQPTVMVNLIGVAMNQQWFSVAGAEVFWYRKSVRPARKVGHINFAMQGANSLCASLQNLQSILSDWYNEPIVWALEELANHSK